MVVVTVFSPAGKPARSRVMPAQDIPLSWPVCAPAGATDHAPSRAHAITARANRLILLLSRDWLPVRRPPLLCDAGGPRIPPLGYAERIGSRNLSPKRARFFKVRPRRPMRGLAGRGGPPGRGPSK